MRTEPLSFVCIRHAGQYMQSLSIQSCSGKDSEKGPCDQAYYGASLGGNGAAIAVSANVIVAGMTEKMCYQITFKIFMLYGIPFMTQTIIISTIYVW